MLRKLNFTERARIPRGAVKIALRRESDGALAFDPTLDLAGVAAPADARVYIEAQYRTSYMRFDCGTVTNVVIPDERRLEEIDSDRVVRFRVKVVEHSGGVRRIVAASNDITVSCEGGESASRLSLLPVNFDDLGDEVWRIHFEGDQPVLELNNRIDSIERLARTDPAFFALVYPAAIREILTRYLLVDGWNGAEGEEWAELWMRWAEEMAGEPAPAESDDRRVWISDVVGAFCGRHRVAEKMRASSEEST